MPTTQSENDKKRRAPRAGSTGGASEPKIPDVDPAELDDDQADSGPDRGHSWRWPLPGNPVRYAMVPT
jgi:hypothetical protein